MKILHVLYSGLGGHGNVFFSFVAADKKNEFVHEALFNGVEDLREEYKLLCAQKSIVYSFVKKKTGADFSFYLKMIRQIRKSNPEVIFLHGSTNILAARIASALSSTKKKIIVRETQANELKTKRDWQRLKMALRFAQRVVFLSTAYEEQVKKKYYNIYRVEKTAVIPNGIDLEMYRPRQKPQGEVTILGMQSRLVDNKDHITLLRAFATLTQKMANKVKLKIAGDGEHKPVLEQKVRELGIINDVEFTGTLGQEVLPNFIHSLDIYVHASLGETMSTAIMQAMACAKAIVASDVPGINNMITQNFTGLLVPVKDHEALAAAIQKLVIDTALARELAANAFQFALDNYSNIVMFNCYRQIFNQ